MSESAPTTPINKCRRGSRGKGTNIETNKCKNFSLEDFGKTAEFTKKKRKSKKTTAEILEENTTQFDSVIKQLKELEILLKKKKGKKSTPKTTQKKSADTSAQHIQIERTIVQQNDQQETQKQRSPKKTKKKKEHLQKESKENENVNNVTNEDVDAELFIDGESSEESASSEDETNEKKTKTPNKKKKGKKEQFPKPIPKAKMQSILSKLDSDSTEYIQGHLHINPKFYKHAYLTMPGTESDLLIIGLRDRNKAFEGDLVVAKLNEEEKWHKLPDGQIQKTGVIVCILEKIHPRRAVGYLKQQASWIVFHPRDQRIPLLNIDPRTVPQVCLTQPTLFEGILFLADVVCWKRPQVAYGRITKIVGQKGDIKAESDAILLQNDIDVTPYSEELMKELPSIEYVPSTEEMHDREDWRNSCVFTIDPITAVDLDDAVSCKLLDNGNYEVGVHISDVTHYLKHNSPLDIAVSKRATTVYMTDNVYHMLPSSLCTVCSLTPGKDKLAFSVIWEMTPDARIIKHRFAKTIINSCCQMAYSHAQMMIDNPDKSWPSDFLNVKGHFTIDDLSKTVDHLYKLSVHLRHRRFADGALRINQPKLQIILDKVTRIPISYCMEEQKESNRLIEEFMLLANMTVAKHLYDTIPDTALLRSHHEPSIRVLVHTRDMLQKFGVCLDIESAGTLQTSIKQYEISADSVSEEMDYITKYRMMVINNLCSKAMTRALYKCSAKLSEIELRHYALNVAFYTHFTSPIRRYSDCVVHRLLYATMQNVSLPSWNSRICNMIANNCNVKKFSAKTAQEQSSELYFTYLVALSGPIMAIATVMDVKERSMDVILCDVGIKLRVYFAEIADQASVQYSTECSVPSVTVTWKQPAHIQVITIFTILYLRVEKHPDLYCLIGFLLPPQ